MAHLVSVRLLATRRVWRGDDGGRHRVGDGGPAPQPPHDEAVLRASAKEHWLHRAIENGSQRNAAAWSPLPCDRALPWAAASATAPPQPAASRASQSAPRATRRLRRPRAQNVRFQRSNHCPRGHAISKPNAIEHNARPQAMSPRERAVWASGRIESVNSSMCPSPATNRSALPSVGNAPRRRHCGVTGYRGLQQPLLDFGRRVLSHLATPPEIVGGLRFSEESIERGFCSVEFAAATADSSHQ